MQLGQMMPYSSLAAEFKRWGASANIFEVEKPRAVSFR
jgi:hypothetical protein